MLRQKFISKLDKKRNFKVIYMFRHKDGMCKGSVDKWLFCQTMPDCVGTKKGIIGLFIYCCQTLPSWKLTEGNIKMEKPKRGMYCYVKSLKIKCKFKRLASEKSLLSAAFGSCLHQYIQFSSLISLLFKPPVVLRILAYY